MYNFLGSPEVKTNESNLENKSPSTSHRVIRKSIATQIERKAQLQQIQIENRKKQEQREREEYLNKKREQRRKVMLKLLFKN